MKTFNTTAVCVPSKHYMVDLTERVREIREMVDAGKYFTINRARQYGKTTTLNELKKSLFSDYTVLSLDFQRIGSDTFQNEGSFSQAMARIFLDLNEFEGIPIPSDTIESFKKLNEANVNRVKLDDLFRIIKRWIKQSDRNCQIMRLPL